MELVLNVHENRVSGPHGRSAHFAHHLAGRFLALLIARKEVGQGVDLHDLAQIWRSAHPASRGPDRTASSRLMRAVLDGLHEATGLPASLTCIASPPRGRTTGPWRLECPEEVEWTVEGAVEPFTSPGGQSPQLGTTRANTLRILEALAVSDERFRSGAFGDAAESLGVLAREGERLSDEGHAVVSLRHARALRRIGDRAGSRKLATQASKWGNAHDGLAARAIRAEADVFLARLDYDAAPGDGRHIGTAHKLIPQAAAAPDPRSLWECLNTCALAARGRLIHIDDRAEQAELHALAERSYESALFWLALLQDHYYLRAVCSNRAHHLTTTSAIGLERGWPEALDWYRLSHVIEDRFNMSIDTALDCVFLAELWLGDPANARHIRSQPVFWIEGHHPGERAFWSRAMELARQENDPAFEREVRTLMKQCLKETTSAR